MDSAMNLIRINSAAQRSFVRRVLLQRRCHFFVSLFLHQTHQFSLWLLFFFFFISFVFLVRRWCYHHCTLLWWYDVSSTFRLHVSTRCCLIVHSQNHYISSVRLLRRSFVPTNRRCVTFDMYGRHRHAVIPYSCQICSCSVGCVASSLRINLREWKMCCTRHR